MEPEVLVKMLLDRQGELVAARKSCVARHLVTSHAQAKHLPEDAFQRNALLSLSEHAYTKCFKPGFTQMDQYECRDCMVEGKPGKQVWYISKPWEAAQIILDGERCHGESCVTFNTQCVHQMKSHGEFLVEKWGTWHLQDIVFEHHHGFDANNDDADADVGGDIPDVENDDDDGHLIVENNSYVEEDNGGGGDDGDGSDDGNPGADNYGDGEDNGNPDADNDILLCDLVEADNDGCDQDMAVPSSPPTRETRPTKISYNDLVKEFTGLANMAAKNQKMAEAVMGTIVAIKGFAREIDSFSNASNRSFRSLIEQAQSASCNGY
jgi:hypothetical protein